MNLLETTSCRIVVICAFIICVSGIVGGVIFILFILGLLPSESNTSWIRYFVTTQTIWRVPLELYVVTIAVLLFIARRSTHWSMLLCTVLLTINLGMIRRNPHDILLWIIILSSVMGLCALNASFMGNLKAFGQGLINDIRNVRQRSATKLEMLLKFELREGSNAQ